jgi:type I restriction enzyme, S subunit
MTTVPEKVQQAYGSLPNGWRLEKLKFFADVRNSNVDKTIAEDEEAVRLCNYTDVYYNDRITPDLEFPNGSATEAEIQKFQLKRGQVIITKDSEGWDDIGIPALVTEDMPDVLCGYHLSVLEPRNELDGGFLAWLCRSEPLNDQFKLGANGVTRYGLGQYPMKNAFVALPPLETQRRIARFLDEKTARIDGLIEKKRALLDRLAEKRQALITRAVTKGLNLAAAMKPSGIDWLGHIPAHWEVKRLRYVAKLLSGSTPTTGVPEYWDGDIPWISPKDMKADALSDSIDKVTRLAIDEYGLREFRQANTIIVIRGMILARRIPVAVASGVYTINQDMKVMESKGLVSPEFLQMYLSAIESFLMTLVAEAGHGTKALRTDVLLDAPTLVPPLAEQVEIIRQVGDQKDQLDRTVQKIEALANRLAEYRAALIAAAVTGKLEIA